MRTIPGFPGYLVSEDGEIFSLWVKGRDSRIDCEVRRKLKPQKHPNGYLHVNIRSESGKIKTMRAHRLICLAFYGEPKKGQECSHLDGKRNNNKPENLCWESTSSNHQRKKSHGTSDHGCQNSRAKINKKQLLMIRDLLAKGHLTHKQVGELIGVSRVFISKIKGGYRYAN